jgi:hypothetical protein
MPSTPNIVRTSDRAIPAPVESSGNGQAGKPPARTSSGSPLINGAAVIHDHLTNALSVTCRQPFPDEREAARRLFADLWEEIGAGGDALHRCALAHSMADVQDDVREELVWDLRAF